MMGHEAGIALVIAFLLVAFILLIGRKGKDGDAPTVHNSQAVVLAKYGEVNPELVCPHCQTRGSVRTMGVRRKKGFSAGKTVGAVATAGLSILAVGISRWEQATRAHCDHCGSTWDF